jgi:hypothetical protein
MLRPSRAQAGRKWPSARSGTVLWLLLALLARLPAQQGERVPTFLRVEDHLGRPLAGAEVTFAGGHPHLGLEGDDGHAGGFTRRFYPRS